MLKLTIVVVLFLSAVHAFGLCDKEQGKYDSIVEASLKCVPSCAPAENKALADAVTGLQMCLAAANPKNSGPVDEQKCANPADCAERPARSPSESGGWVGPADPREPTSKVSGH
jgi:hypothetical protein